jgi:hypothetical protein
MTKPLLIVRHVGFRSSSRRKENGFVSTANRFVAAGSDEVCSRSRNSGPADERSASDAALHLSREAKINAAARGAPGDAALSDQATRC